MAENRFGENPIMDGQDPEEYWVMPIFAERKPDAFDALFMRYVEADRVVSELDDQRRANGGELDFDGGIREVHALDAFDSITKDGPALRAQGLK